MLFQSSGAQAQRSQDKSSLPQTQEQTPAERAALEEVWQLKTELSKSFANTAAAVELASEREPTKLGGGVDRLRSRECYRDPLLTVGEIFICSWLSMRGCKTCGTATTWCITR
jgi:hypothetical protein